MASSFLPPQFYFFFRENQAQQQEEEDATQHHQQHLEAEAQQLPTASAGRTTRRRKRRLPGTPKENAEVVALSPEELLATHRFECNVCQKGFQREQNLRLHLRGHNMDWRLIKRDLSAGPARRKVYVCPEPNCIHHDPARALGDLTGIKKHYSRKHGQRLYPCPNCSRSYAVLADIKAHLKICVPSLDCSCGASFPTEDALIAHKSLCDASSSNTSNASPKAAISSNTSNASPKGTSPAVSSNTSPSVTTVVSALPAFSPKPKPSVSTTIVVALPAFPSKKPTSLKPTSLKTTSLKPTSDAANNTSKPLTDSNGFTENTSSDSLQESCMNIYNAFNEITAINPSSLSLVAEPYPDAAAVNPFEYSLNAYTGLGNFEPLQQSKQDDDGSCYGNADIMSVFALSKDHPMLNYPGSSVNYTPHSDMPSTSTCNFLQPPVAEK